MYGNSPVKGIQDPDPISVDEGCYLMLPFFQKEASVMSPRKNVYFHYLKSLFWIEVSKKHSN